jgi:ATP-dependent DNA ligase
VGAQQHRAALGSGREVSPQIVLEVAFDNVHRSTRHRSTRHRSTRHRSGVAMRFRRIHRIRWEKALPRSRHSGDAGTPAYITAP